MSTTLGLDLGTNSLGWALVEDGKRVINSGVRIFPVGVKEDDFLKQGKEVSKNVGRRIARGIRRRFHRYKIRRENLVSILTQYEMLPRENEFFSTKELYELRVRGLDEKLPLTEFGRVLMMLNKRRGFKSNRKALTNEEAKKEEGKVKGDILKLQMEIANHSCRTVGEYFAFLFKETGKNPDWHNKDEAMSRIRSRFVGREMYMHEFDELWKKQSSFYPTVLTSSLRDKIRDEIIYYQRNLKSQKWLVSRCRFEPTKRCTPKSSMLFQEFRIWQQLSVVRFANSERIGQELTLDEKQKVSAFLIKRRKCTRTEFKKLLNISRNVEFNDVFDLIGNTTVTRLIDAIGETIFDSLNDTQIFELWHILTYTDNTEKLNAIVSSKIAQGILPSLNDEAIERYSEINLEEGYGNFSTKALKRILPYLREGLSPFEAFQKAGYDPTKKIVKGKQIELMKIPPLTPNELRNPIVQQMLCEAFRVVNAIVAKHGKPDMIRVELAREIKKPKDKREEARNQAIQKRKQREDYTVFLSKYLKKIIEPSDPEVRKYELWLEMGCEDPKLDDLDSFLKKGRVIEEKKYRLWKECGRISPYSGKVISLTKLFSPEIQIEHILPYSKTMNNEFTNLCLCEENINKEKGNKLPHEYFASKGEKAFEEFKKRIAVFKGGKRSKFLAREIPDDFLNSQINNTGYAARELASRLEVLLPPKQDGEKQKTRVQIVNGQATGTLRRLWGMNAILSMGDIDTKNRGDHRHHAIDAMVIACTTPSLVHTLATYSKFDAMNKLKNEKVKQPWDGFLSDANEAINAIIISYRNQKRLVGKRPNKVKQKDLRKYPDGFLKKSNITIRGPLHEETLYGSIEMNGEDIYVTRWPLKRFTKVEQLEKIVDRKVREVLMKRVKSFDNDIKKAFAENPDNPVLMYSKNGFTIPIRKVRVMNPTENLIEVRPRVFVESGSNHKIAIYQDPENGKRDFQTISFWEATQRVLNKKPVVPTEMNKKPLLFSLTQYDTVVMYHVHPDEIDWDDIEYLKRNLFRVIKFDVNGIIVFGYLYASKLDMKEDRKKEFPLVIQKVPNTLRCIRVDIDILGRIRKTEGA